MVPSQQQADMPAQFHQPGPHRQGIQEVERDCGVCEDAWRDLVEARTAVPVKGALDERE